MHARALFLGLAWLVIPVGRAQEIPPAKSSPPATLDLLDGGLLDPKWFGPGPVWNRDWRVDFFWARPGVRLDPPAIYLQPWAEPSLLAQKDPLDYAAGWEAAEFLQHLLRTRLNEMLGVRLLATSPEQTPYHAMGRIVEATHIRQGATATLGPFAGLPTFTWDFKVVDIRTGHVVLASHHRSVWCPSSLWVSAMEAPLRQLVGLPPIREWEVPPGIQEHEDGSWTWVTPGLRLAPGSLEVGHWMAQTETGGLWKAWSNGMGTRLAMGTQSFLQTRLKRSKLAKPGEEEATYLLTGQVYTHPKYLKPRYRAILTEVGTGRVVARHEIRSPFAMNPAGIADKVAERVISHLETLVEEPPKPFRPGDVAAGVAARLTSQPGPASAWEGFDRLAPAKGPVDKAWVSPVLNLADRTLQVSEWSEPTLQPEADSHDYQVARAISSRAPAWLYGALAAYSGRGFRIHRHLGDLRLEGRVVHLDQPDRSKFSTMMGQAFTFGLSAKAAGIIQLRIVEAATGRTLALVEQDLVSFQAASDGIPYKAFKWLAQGLVPWLLEMCRGLDAERPPSGGLSIPDRKELSPSLPGP